MIVRNATQKGEYQEWLSTLASLYGIDDTVCVTILENPAMLRCLSKEVEVSAITYPTLEGYYTMVLGDNCNKTILCHEFAHILQFHSGDLKVDMSTNTYWWKGKRYRDIPYEQRPWEKEALDMQGKLYKTLNKSLKNKA